jgi:hypothetical protein
MSDEEIDLDQAWRDEIADLEAFEARFQPDAFKRVASALNLRDTEEDLKAIGHWLLPYFYNFFSGRPYKEPPRKERIAKLKKLLAALDIVRNGIPPRASFMDFPTTIGEMGETNEFLLGKLDEYYRRVGEKLRKLEAGPARRGPKPKTTFRDFTPDPDLALRKDGRQGGEEAPLARRKHLRRRVLSLFGCCLGMPTGAPATIKGCLAG